VSGLPVPGPPGGVPGPGNTNTKGSQLMRSELIVALLIAILIVVILILFGVSA
jgi:hypothetical protein